MVRTLRPLHVRASTSLVQRSVAALFLGALVLATASAQPFTWPEEYVTTVRDGGTVIEPIFGDITSLNAHVPSGSADEVAILGMTGGPSFLYRDWLGDRTFGNPDDGWNMYWASDIEELDRDRDYIVTIREGWEWSDGTPITMDDVVAARIVHGDPDTQSNSISCTLVGDEPVTYEVLDERRIRITLPVAQVNGLAIKDCGTVPAHLVMPVHESGGGAAVAGMWGTATPVSELVSGGPYQVAEFRSGERLVLERNPNFTFELAPDGTPMTGPDQWIVTISQDQNAVLAQVLTGETSFWWPTTLDQMRAIQQGVQGGTIPGTLYPNISPGTLVDYVSYNFNSSNECKATMFRESRFRRAMSQLMDREAMVQGALGGLGFPANDWVTSASAPFDPSFMDEMPFDPEGAVALLRSIGFTETASDGVLRNPTTGCRAEFDLEFNTGNNRRAQIALIFSQTASEYGVRVNPREVSVELWQNALLGTTLPRASDFDSVVWGLAGGDVDSPAAINVFGIAANINVWNKDADNVAPWEVLLEALHVEMGAALDIEDRVALYREGALLMQENLPLTPTIAASFHFYENLGNVWPEESLDALSIQSSYRPGNFRGLLMAAP